MQALKSSNYKLPKKTRDIYLYMPLRMMGIFPTVGLFGNLNLQTGHREREINFYPTSAVRQKGAIIYLANRIRFNVRDGELDINNRDIKVQTFSIASLRKNGSISVRSNLYHMDGRFSVVFMKSYKRFVIMDNTTYNSAFVQMFMLGRYDKNLFDLVVASPYSRIYRVKK
jgi:dolichyl-diphosphooligosaccharide--protein glycosyltransferase/undecaprenyl-diphosphooligosaccharide--protein glycosyltransferase